MERNTQTTLAELRVGDRFVFVGRVDKWQVTQQELKYSLINAPGLGGKLIYSHDKKEKNTKVVVFLRHTMPLPGEKCLLEDLKNGDTFYEDGIPEAHYSIMKSRDRLKYWQYMATNLQTGKLCFFDQGAEITFVGRVQEVIL